MISQQRQILVTGLEATSLVSLAQTSKKLKASTFLLCWVQ